MRTGDSQTCPNVGCDGHLSPAAGMAWRSPRGNDLPWVFTCIACNIRTGEDSAWGLDEEMNLVGPIESFMHDADLGGW